MCGLNMNKPLAVHMLMMKSSGARKKTDMGKKEEERETLLDCIPESELFTSDDEGRYYLQKK